jgi:hypothetical protein
MVKWVKGSEFGVDFDAFQSKKAKQITKVVAMLVKTQHGLSRNG